MKKLSEGEDGQRGRGRRERKHVGEREWKMRKKKGKVKKKEKEARQPSRNRRRAITNTTGHLSPPAKVLPNFPTSGRRTPAMVAQKPHLEFFFF